MSTSASIDVQLKEKNLSCIEIIKQMQNKGWNLEKNGKTSFLPYNDDMYNWEEDYISEEELYNLLEKKQEEKEIIGLVLYWKETNIGIDMLFLDRQNISFGLNCNRVCLDLEGMNNITDVNWYLSRILPCFKSKRQNKSACTTFR